MVGKNVRLVAGEPLVAHSIRAASESSRLTHFLTSTDSEQIAAVASEYGSEVLIRPAHLAQDESPVVPVVMHALQEAEKRHDCQYDAIVLLQPTSPIRSGRDIDAVIAMLEEDPQVEGVISVCPMDDVHPARMYSLHDGDWMAPLSPEGETTQRQSLPVVYYRNGSIYAVRKSVLLEQRTVMARRKKAYVMPREWLANIDDERDLMIADVLLRAWKESRA